MSKKLYRATCEVEVYFVADEGQKVSDFEIEDFAAEEARDNGMSVGYVTQVRSIDDVPTEWRDGLPYGQDDEQQTVAEILGEKP